MLIPTIGYRVFDSVTGLGIAGAQVNVLSNGQPARSERTGQVIQLTTDSTGRYSLPRMAAGSFYTLQVVAPSGYRFPSAFAPERFTQHSVVNASYGELGYANSSTGAGQFSVLAGEASPIIDIPLDPLTLLPELMINKQVDVATLSLGDK